MGRAWQTAIRNQKEHRSPRDCTRILILSDHANPSLIVHRNWSPPFGGGTHSPLPLPGRDLLVVADVAVLDNEEDGRKHTWIFDIREPSNPIRISTFPIPDEQNYTNKGGHFGAHNLHEKAWLLRIGDTDFRDLAKCRDPRFRHLRSLSSP